MPWLVVLAGLIVGLGVGFVACDLTDETRGRPTQTPMVGSPIAVPPSEVTPESTPREQPIRLHPPTRPSIARTPIAEVNPESTSREQTTRPQKRTGPRIIRTPIAENFRFPAWDGRGRDVTGIGGFEGLVVELRDEGGLGKPSVGPSDKVKVTLQTRVELPFDKGPALVVPTPPSKISASLQERINDAKPDERENIVVHLRDPIDLKPMPRFGAEERGTKEFEAVQIQRESYIKRLQAARNKQAAEFVNRLRRLIKLEPIYVPWLSSTPVVSMRITDVEGLAKSDDVISVSLDEGELEPSYVVGIVAMANDDVMDVRQAMGTDPYDNLGNNWGYIGVIDSGKRITHDMLDDDVANDYKLVTRLAQDNDTQRWILTDLGDDTYTIQQKSTSRYMDAHGDNALNDLLDFSVVTRPYQDNDTQRWILTKSTGHSYTIQQKSNNLYLDAYERKDGHRLVTRLKQENDTQKWVLTPSLGTSIDSVYHIQQKSTGRYMDAYQNDNLGAFAGDCNQGGKTCWGDGGPPIGKAGDSFPNYDISDSRNHGTPILGAIRGSDDLGVDLRGITRITTDHWKVTNNLNPDVYVYSDVQRAIQKAISVGNDVISNSYGDWGTKGGLDLLSQHFDDAYDNGLIVIVSTGNDACQTRKPDFRLVTRAAQENDTQRWILTPALGTSDDNSYTIQQKSNNRFVDAYEGAAKDFTVVTRWPEQNDDTQRWILTDLGNDIYTIQQKSSNRFLDAHQKDAEDWSVVTRLDQENETQKWILTELGWTPALIDSNTYTIQQKSNYRFLDAHRIEGTYEDSKNDKVGTCGDRVLRTGAILTDENNDPLYEPAFGSVLDGASAHKVIAVGAHDIDPPCTEDGFISNVCGYSGRGPTTDGRYKPDILGYSHYKTSIASGDDKTDEFGGTSAAAPTVAAMAMLYNNFLEHVSDFATWLTPGHIYAALIASGEHTTKWEGSYDYIGVEPGIAKLNIEGVGRPKMVAGPGLFGTVTLNDVGDLATIEVDVPVGVCGIQAGIWWPEDVDQAHNDVDLIIRSPQKQVIADALSGNSVWERASVDGENSGLAEGKYEVQILGFDVSSQQPVYYFINVPRFQC